MSFFTFEVLGETLGLWRTGEARIVTVFSFLFSGSPLSGHSGICGISTVTGTAGNEDGPASIESPYYFHTSNKRHDQSCANRGNFHSHGVSFTFPGICQFCKILFGINYSHAQHIPWKSLIPRKFPFSNFSPVVRQIWSFFKEIFEFFSGFPRKKSFPFRRYGAGNFIFLEFDRFITI